MIAMPRYTKYFIAQNIIEKLPTCKIKKAVVKIKSSMNFPAEDKAWYVMQ